MPKANVARRRQAAMQAEGHNAKGQAAADKPGEMSAGKQA